jgi:glycosyltransferase involved in cell wall biosynthesis
VIPEGVDIERFRRVNSGDFICRRFSIPERFLFYPAQMWHHKNHITLLRALRSIEKHHGQRIPLVLTGAAFDAAAGIFQFLSRESMGYVHCLGKVNFDDLVALYKKASLLVMPSLYESSSLPVLEAAAAGVPIIASDIPPCQEFAKILRLNLFPATDVSALGELITSLWNDDSAVSKQVSHNRQHIGSYSWENAAAKLLDVCVAAA